MWGHLPHQVAKDCDELTFGHGESAAKMLPCWELIDAVETLPANELIGLVEMLTPQDTPRFKS